MTGKKWSYQAGTSETAARRYTTELVAMKFPRRRSCRPETAGWAGAFQSLPVLCELLVHDLHVVEADREVGPCVEERDLRPQLVVARPVVVSVQQRDVPPAGRPEAARDDLVRAQIPLGEQEAEEVRVAVRVLLHDLARAVGRAVFRNEDLERLWEPLRKRAVERLPHEPLVVVRDDEHGDRDRRVLAARSSALSSLRGGDGDEHGVCRIDGGELPLGEIFRRQPVDPRERERDVSVLLDHDALELAPLFVQPACGVAARRSRAARVRPAPRARSR